jgi:hypothetical protein
MGDDHSVHHNISLGVGLPTPSRSVGPRRASSGFLCIDKSEIYVHHLNLDLNLNTMVSTELHCVQLFIRYIPLVTTLMLDKLPCAGIYCHAVHCISRIVK